VKKLVVIAVFAVFFFAAFKSDAQKANLDATGQAEPAEKPEVTNEGSLPSQFRAFSLGMSLEDLKTELEKDPYFAFRGDRDVSFLPLSQQNLVESAGLNFIKRAFFQLKDNTVFIMSFSLNTSLIDHYSVYSSFVKKYGEPLSLNPKEAVWESETTRISIERPLTVKYIDRVVFDTLVEDSRAGTSKVEALREDFLNDF
jgi:hypothetical protein